MALIDESEGLKWNVPFDRKKPVIYVKDCRKQFPDREHYKELYDLTCDLTDTEKTSKYAKYYCLGQAMPDRDVYETTELGKDIDPSEAFLIEQYPEKMDVPGCCSLKNGFCVLPGGIGFAMATTCRQGISAEVMSYFIDNYNPPEDLYYKTWCPGAHIRHYESSAIEDLGFGMSLLQFTEGLTAEKIGLSVPAKNDKYCIGLTGANFRLTPFHNPDAEPLYVAELCYYRQMEDGYEERVTFWIGSQFENGKTVPHLPKGKPVDPLLPLLFARHSQWETSTLFRNIVAFWNDRNT